MSFPTLWNSIMARFILLGREIVNVDLIATIGKCDNPKHNPDEWIKVKYAGGWSTSYRTTIDTVLRKIMNAKELSKENMHSELTDEEYITEFLTAS